MMASRSPSRLAVSRHVHLRTQQVDLSLFVVNPSSSCVFLLQRRLRHVRTVIVRNLTIAESELYLGSPLALAVHFTLHPTHDTETGQLQKIQNTYELELISPVCLIISPMQCCTRVSRYWSPM